MAEHHHHHDHNHGPTEGSEEVVQSGMDAAGASLANALKISFRVLTFIIVVLCVLFLLQGLFKVDPGKKVVVLRFGEAKDQLVMDQGLHFVFPYPIDERIDVSVSPKQLEVNTFWTGATKLAQEDAIKKGLPVPEIIPGAEGAHMLTGDMNGLQARWDITYRIQSENEAVLRYYTKIGTQDNEERLVRSAVQSAVISEVGRVQVFDVYPTGKDLLTEMVKGRLDRMFAEMDCGIRIEKVNLIDVRPPPVAKQAFDDVLGAQQEVDQMLQEAERTSRKTLIDAAGEVGPELGQAIRKLWEARDAGDSNRVAAAEKEISGLYEKAGGKARTTLANARAYKTGVIESARGDAIAIEKLLANPPADLNVLLTVNYLEALQIMLGQSFEKYLYRPVAGNGTRPTVDIQINRTPDILLHQTTVRDTR